MAPKKGQKMSLNEFLGDNSLGSWADEMDSLPTAPAPRLDDGGAGGYGRPDFASRPDRAPLPPREEVPLPTAPPYTAFVGNLAFDMTEGELEEFFAPHKTVSVKIISDREGKPKGFGYVEFTELEGLKNALTKSGATLSHRTVRVNVAEPPKERERGGGFGGGFDDDKYAGPWRREGPLPPAEPRRGSGFGFKDRAPLGDDEGPRRGSRFQPVEERPELNSDWRSSVRGPLPPLERERDREPKEPRRGFGSTFENSGAADADDTWAKGSKFKPSTEPAGSVGRKFGSGFERPGSGTAIPSAADEGDWRSRSKGSTRSPTTSTPPTPQPARRKLELLPRSGGPSNSGTPLASPSPTSSGASKSSPFGAAKPVDVTAREREVEERLTKEREEHRHPLSRETSRQASSREPAHPLSRETSRQGTTRTAHPMSRETSRQGSTRGPSAPPAAPRPASSTVRPAFSFANAARSGAPAAAVPKEEKSSSDDNTAPKEEEKSGEPSTLNKITEKVAEITEKVTGITV